MKDYNTGYILSQEERRLVENHVLTKRLHPTHFGISKCKTGFTRRPQGAKEHILILCVDGFGILEKENRKYEISPNHILLIPANVTHGYGVLPGHSWNIYWAHFRGEDSEFFFKHITKAIFLRKYPDAAFMKALSLYREFHNCIYNNIKQNSLIKASQILSCLLSFLFFSDTADTSSENARKGVEKAIDLMGKNLDRSFSLEELACFAGLSKPHFSFLFKKTSGFSPIEYFNTLKMHRACQYLDATSMNIGEISEKLGMENQHYFSRLFSKVMGISPRNYRNKKWYGYE